MSVTALTIPLCAWQIVLATRVFWTKTPLREYGLSDIVVMAMGLTFFAWSMWALRYRVPSAYVSALVARVVLASVGVADIVVARDLLHLRGPFYDFRRVVGIAAIIFHLAAAIVTYIARDGLRARAAAAAPGEIAA